MCGLSTPWVVPESAAQPWIVYVNPPFNDVDSWLSKALDEIRAGRVKRVAMLLPVRGYAQWWNRKLLPYAAGLTNADGGIRFLNYDKIYPWGCVLALFTREKVAAVDGAAAAAADATAAAKAAGLPLPPPPPPPLVMLTSYRFHK